MVNTLNTKPLVWVELVQLNHHEDFEQFANYMFQVPDPEIFNLKLGIDIFKYKGFWAEIKNTEAILGPVNPATDRIRIKPILAIRKADQGHFYVDALSASTGLINLKYKKAWIPIDEYKVMLGDMEG